jgi:hypothetical protein
MNPLRRLLFGTGRLPEDVRRELNAEGILLVEEGLRGSITYRHDRAPRRRSTWEKQRAVVAIGGPTGAGAAR